MVIDFHTHVFPDSLAPRAIASLVEACGGAYPPQTDGTYSGLIDSMDKSGVQISVLQPVITKQSQFNTLNNFSKGLGSERIVPFGGLFPHTDDYKRDIDYIVSLGLKGIKLHPEYQQFFINDEKMLKIYDYALNKGLILLFHAGFDPAFKPPYHSNPKAFAEIYKALGGGVIVAAHLGGQKQWDEVEEYLAGTGVYLDTSMGFKYYGKEQFERIVKKHGADKILFGSDSPWGNAHDDIKALKECNLTEAEKEQILFKNAKRILEI